MEQKTKQQSKCPLWYELRKCRITSSNFGTVAKRKNAFKSLAKQLTCNKQLSHVPSLKWGVDHEGAAHQQYELQHKSHQVIHSGLWIDIERGWLASSPDGLIYNQNELVGILEIKCPYSARDMTPVKAAEKLPSFFCEVVNGNLSLKKITTTISKCKASLQSLMQTGVIFVCIHHMVSLLNASHLTSHFGKVLYTN